MAYLVLTSAPGQPHQELEALVAVMDEVPEWRRSLVVHGLAVFLRGKVAPRITPVGGFGGVRGVILGEVFDRTATEQGQARRAELGPLGDSDPADAAQTLVQEAWGDYVAVLDATRAHTPTVLRAPMGSLEAYVWRRGAVTLIGSAMPDPRLAPQGLAIDWTRLAQVLADPMGAVGTSPLVGVAGVAPGQVWRGGSLETLWSPAKIVRAAKKPPPPSALRRTIDGAILAHALEDKTLLVEISGGLDSSIVATSLAALDRRPAGAVNFYRDQAEGDERVYAQAVAEAAKIALTTVRREPFSLDDAAFAIGASALRPDLNAVDPDYDRLLCTAIEQAGAQVLFTGHGGDAVFYQLGAAEIAADLLGGAKCEGSRLSRLADIARRTRRSVWSLAWQALRGRPGALAPELAAERPGLGLPPPAAPSDWRADRAGLTPARRVQVRGLLTCLTVYGATARGETARLAHPLLAQPVVELCLATPIPILSAGEGERSLARTLFADRLPAIVAGRRSKGDVTAFFGQTIAASAQYLSDHLLKGRLAEKGLLSPKVVQAALEPEMLIWRDTYGELLVAATLEAWVRHWEGVILAPGGAAPDGAPKLSLKNEKARA